MPCKQFFMIWIKLFSLLLVIAAIIATFTPGGFTHMSQWLLHRINRIHFEHVSRYVNVYDTHQVLGKNLAYKCMHLNMTPSPYICIFDPERDTLISKTIFEGGVWEAQHLKQLTRFLKQDLELGVVDVGANLAEYSLVSAMMGRSVVAVEALHEHVQMTAQSVQMNNLHHRITLVHNAVLNRRIEVCLAAYTRNSGSTFINNFVHKNCPFAKRSNSVLIDDLIPLISFKKAILKIDIEGFEVEAIQGASTFFNTVFVPYIFMEWEHVADRLPASDKSCELLDRMLSMNYKPFNENGTALLLRNWRYWGLDVIWVHKDYKF